MKINLTMKTNMRVLVIDDHPLFLTGMCNILQSFSETAQILEANTGEQALSLLHESPNLDWIFLDMNLPDLNGVEFLAELRKRRISIPVIMLSAIEDPAIVDRSLRAGASGYLSKTTLKDEIELAMTTMAKGRAYVGKSLRRRLDQFRSGLYSVDSGQSELTRRQRQILILISEGLSNLEIAGKLELSESTVKGHVSTLYELLNVKNRTSCIAVGRKMGLIN